MLLITGKQQKTNKRVNYNCIKQIISKLVIKTKNLGW